MLGDFLRGVPGVHDTIDLVLTFLENATLNAEQTLACRK